MRRLAAAALVGLTTVACDPSTHVRAHVTTSSACGADAPRPLEGAVVTLRCGKETRPLGKTDADGRFVYRKLGEMTDDCTLDVTREGYELQQYRVADVCATGTLVGHCPFVYLQPALRAIATSEPPR